MKQGSTKLQRTGRPSPAMIIAIIALIASLSGSAYAALAKNSKLKRNSVGTKQLKKNSVKTGKIQNGAVRSKHVQNGSLTGQEIRVSALGMVGAATNAGQAGNTGTVGGHAAGCPGGTTLIRGICFDSASNPVANGVKAAADGCAAKGGYLPTAQELYSAKGILNLGTGIGTDRQHTDTWHSTADKANEQFRTIVIDGTGTLVGVDVSVAAEYICIYPLVR